MLEITHPKFIVGKRLYLRPLDPRTDTERCYGWMNDREVTQWLLRHTPIPFPAQQRWIEDITKERSTTDFVFAVVLREGDVHIGNVGLHRIDWIDRTASTGWVIGEKSEWKKGYGFEAVALMLGYAFTSLNLRKITSATIAPNTASSRIHEKCGYQKIGTRQQQFFRDGAYHDEFLWEVFAEDFARVEHQALVHATHPPLAEHDDGVVL